MISFSATLTVGWYAVRRLMEVVWSIHGLCINLWLEWTVYINCTFSHFLVSSGRQYRFSRDTVLEHSKNYTTTYKHGRVLTVRCRVDMARTTTELNANMAANAASQQWGTCSVPGLRDIVAQNDRSATLLRLQNSLTYFCRHEVCLSNMTELVQWITWLLSQFFMF
jgi:hypothetical protein